ncbi:MAG: undecaprenyl-diphosphate phosphatase [Ruminococcaceae bacterium]|nr:undecaprenyl-diphosphate phosphatase [Oscillospiraceae bacterium]
MVFIEILKAILIGIVQGITEWLPVSSTGHMIIVNDLVPLKVSSEFWELFEVVIQLGSILAIIVLFFDKLNPWSKNKTPELKKKTWSLWLKVVIATIPTAIIGVPIDLLFDYLVGDSQLARILTICVALIVYGIAFILIERLNKNKSKKCEDVYEIDYKTAIGIGCFQSLSVIPGTSRSGSTILGASVLGVSRSAAAEFSFFLAIPVMLGASLLKGAKAILIDHISMTSTEVIVLIVGTLTAFAVSLVAVKFLMSFVKNHSFEVFGWYRIAIGAILIVYALIKY